MTFEEMKAKYLREMGAFTPVRNSTLQAAPQSAPPTPPLVRPPEQQPSEPELDLVTEIPAQEQPPVEANIPIGQNSQMSETPFVNRTPANTSTESPDMPPMAEEMPVDDEGGMTGNAPQVNLPISAGNGKTADDFESYTETGYIRVTVFAANQAVPISDAKVTISKYQGTNPLVFVETKTDESGNTPVISLPAPPKSLSQSPQPLSTPYGVYNIVVSVQNFRSLPVFNIPVFSGVVSVQPIELNPLTRSPNPASASSERE